MTLIIGRIYDISVIYIGHRFDINTHLDDQYKYNFQDKFKVHCVKSLPSYASTSEIIWFQIDGADYSDQVDLKVNLSWCDILSESTT